MPTTYVRRTTTSAVTIIVVVPRVENTRVGRALRQAIGKGIVRELERRFARRQVSSELIANSVREALANALENFKSCRRRERHSAILGLLIFGKEPRALL